MLLVAAVHDVDLVAAVAELWLLRCIAKMALVA